MDGGAAGTKKPGNKFIMKNPENADFNQYWYSPKTIEILAD